ncbi:MAG: sulfite exporter TauE/SafE family protein [Clostridia bacterium]|nr:sulfite exporter TauE/SafE family protein [Clostridia bacterium]
MMKEIEILQVVLTVLVGIGAGFVQRVSGFGLGIFSMMFMPHFMTSNAAAATISCLLSSGTSTYNAVKYRKQIVFKTIIPLICAASITIPIAVYFSVWVSGKIFKIILGVVLICFSVYFFTFENRITIKPSLKSSLIAGGIGGTLNGLFSTGGPPVVLYLSNATTDKMVYFAGIQFYFAVTNIYSVIFRFINGIVTPSVLLYALAGFVGCMVGDMLGKHVFDKMDTRKLKIVIYVGMIISGVLMFF